MDRIFIDANIFMYAVGAKHPHKGPSEKIIRTILAGQREGVINTEVLQEILYRYSAIGKPKIGYELFDTVIKTFPIIWAVEREDVIQARQIQERHGIKTRDAIHLATMKRNGVTTLCSFDTDFDQIPGISRIVSFDEEPLPVQDDH